MAGPRADKVAVVEEVKGHLANADAAILTEYRGLKVGDLATLRRALRGAGAEYKIYKNTLVRRATADTPHAAMDTMLVGPTAIAFIDKDVAAAAKVLREFAKTHPALVVKGSFVGSGVLDARTTNALADLPSREVLLAQIAGALAAPMRQFAGLLKALPQSLAYGISALIDQRVAGGEALPAVAAPDAGEGAGAASGGDTSAGDDTSAPAAEAAAADPEVDVVEAAPAGTSEPEATSEPKAIAEAAPAEAAEEPEPEASAAPELAAEPAPEVAAEPAAEPEPEVTAEADQEPQPADETPDAEAAVGEAAVSPPEATEAAASPEHDADEPAATDTESE